MFSLTLVLNLNSFRVNSLWSKASLVVFGTLGVCSTVLVSPEQQAMPIWDDSASAWQDISDSPKLSSCCTCCTLWSISLCCVLEKCPGLPVTRALQLPAPCPLITQQVTPLAGSKGTCPRLPSISGAGQRWFRVTGVNPRCALEAGNAFLSCSSWDAPVSDSSH